MVRDTPLNVGEFYLVMKKDKRIDSHYYDLRILAYFQLGYR